MSFAKRGLLPAVFGIAALFVAGCAMEPAKPIGASVVAQPDRSADDRKTDDRRKPAELVDFSGVQPGMTVLDMMAGGGYTTEVFARAVGPKGKVYAQLPPGRNQASLAERAKKPGINIVIAEAPIDSPVPAGVHDLDLITLILNYHDITYLPVDRAKMNKALFDGLKHGGALIIVDHAAKAGVGVTVAKTLHRIEEATLIAEVEAAGFKKAAEGDFLRVPSDNHETPMSDVEKAGGHTDQFALKFVKP